MDKNMIMKAARDYSMINYEAEVIAEEYLKLNGKHCRGIESVSFDEDVVEFSYGSSGCYCCPESSYDTFPLEYMWTDNWQKIEKKRVDEKKQAKKLAKKKKLALEKDEKAKRKEEKDAVEYERLKQKYEGEK